jgi:hypothetical protein
LLYLRNMKEKPKGGKRSGAGRKPSPDPKQPITIFVETSIIESCGGKEGVQLFCYSALGSNKTPSIVLDEVRSPLQKKKFPPSDREIKQRGLPLPDDYVKIKKVGAIKSDGTVIKDVTKLHRSASEPQEQPKIKIPHQIHPDAPMVASGPPKTLDELKSRCPAELKGIDRTIWISEQKEKYGI